MKYALYDQNGIIVNVIEYDGKSIYRSIEGFTLHEINDWVNIGDHKDTPKLQEKTK